MAKRNKKTRGAGEGTVHRRPDGRWIAQISLGNDPVTGKRKRKTVYGKTRKEAVEKMTQILHQAQTGIYVEPTRITLGNWLDRWLVTYKRADLEESTYENYEGNIKRHIKPVLGDVPLAKLQPHTLQDFYNEKLESGRIDGKGGLSTRMVRYFHAIIRQALQQAVKEGLIPRNVADATSPPVIRNKKMQPLTEDQAVTFFEYARGDRLFAAYVLCATTGLRRGEICGLCWDCVDLNGGVVIVRRQMQILKRGLTLKETTKTKSGRRQIALTDDAIKELKNHRRRQAQEKLLMGEAYQNNDMVFCEADGTFFDPRRLTKRFQRLLQAAGLPKVRLHDLRHTHASLLLARGVHPKVVQERLGHSSITMTLDLYSHLAPGMDEAAAASLNGLLQKKAPAEQQGQ